MSYKKITILVLVLFVSSSLSVINKLEAQDRETNNFVETDSFTVSSEPTINGDTFTTQATEAENTSLLFSWDENYGNPYCVYYSDSRAYVGTAMGLVIVDVSVVDTPIYLTTFQDSNFICQDVIVEGDLAYVANAAVGVYILNISDPFNIDILDQYTSSGSAQDLHKVGNALFVADHSNGLNILNVAVPTAITFHGQYNNGSGGHDAYGVYVNESYAYVCFDEWGVDVIDISTLSSPTYVSNYYYYGYAMDIIVKGNYGFIAATHGYMEIANLTDKNNPEYVTRFVDVLSNPDNLFMVGDTVFLPDDESLDIIDVSDVTNPTRISEQPAYNNMFDVFVSGDIAYCADQYYGLVLYNISDLANPVWKGMLETKDSVSDIFLVDDLAYITNTYDGLRIFNVSDPWNVVQIGNYTEQYRWFDAVYVVDDLAYVSASSWGLVILNVSDPTAITWVNRISTAGAIADVIVQDNLAYLAGTSSELLIYDVSNPFSYLFWGSYNGPDGYSQNIFINGTAVFVADGSDGLNVINITDNTTPTPLDIYDDGGYCYDVWVQDQYVIVADGPSGIEIYDGSDLTALTLVSSYDPPTYSVRGLYVVGDLLYIGDSAHGMRVFNWSDPANIFEVGYYNEDFSDFTDVTVSDDGTIFVAGRDDGFRILILDNDQDNISNYDELNVYNTDPNNNDTDADEINDWDEINVYLTDPLDDDTDDDLIRDGDELIFGTNPLEPDSDFDGVDDRWEVDHGTDPWDTDTDDDLLTDGDEVNMYGSDPLLADTDSDGLDDWEEVNLGVDGYLTSVNDDDTDDDGINDGDEHTLGTIPTDADTDDDGLLDGEEIELGDDGYITSPFDPDSDNDGLNDGDEYTHGTNPNVQDTDGDSYTDNEEVNAGTDPLDPEDYPGATTPPTTTPTPTPTVQNGFGIILIASISVISMLTISVLVSKRRRK